MRTRLYIASTDALTDPARFERLAQTIPPARREKLDAFRHDGARRLSLAASLLLVRALSDNGLHADEIALTKYGKPYLPTLPDFHFSLSHSGNVAMCAVSPREIGCDIEAPRGYDAKIAKRFFHPAEQEWLFSRPEPEQPDVFFRLWTCKESFVKALGLGLSLGLDSFAAIPCETVRLMQSVDARPWRMLSFKDGESFIALCGLESAIQGRALSVVATEFDAMHVRRFLTEFFNNLP
jgi:4'-phosphopantetheinyl transferase